MLYANGLCYVVNATVLLSTMVRVVNVSPSK